MGEDRRPPPAGERLRRIERSRTSVENNPWASQSMTSLHLSQNESASQPLFGEVLSPRSVAAKPGFGIPTRQRRGSEGGSQPYSPKSHQKSRSEVDLAPASPRDWYLSVPSELDGRENLHRRAKSDFAGDPAIPADASGLVLGHSPSGSVSESVSNPKRDSHSRIPISTRRLSDQSDTTAKSTATLSAPVTPKSSRLRGTSASRKPNHIVITPAAMDSRSLHPQHKDQTSKPQGGSSPSLKAYISAPLPKKSPPLRSSRPRQPVSSASTSSSRGKVVERYDAAHQDRNAGKRRPAGAETKPTPKNIPELGAVDFAARRERIQRAFTISMREREKKDEDDARKRVARRASEREARAQERIPMESLQPNAQLSHRERDLGSESANEIERRGQDGSNEHDAQEVQGEKRLTLDTQMPPNQSREQPTDLEGAGQDESPILGMPGTFPDSKEHIPREDQDFSGVTPTSAVTADTVTTPIDNEPQDDRITPPSPRRHQTVLSQVMQMRDESPESPTHTQPGEDSASEQDEKESIQIMLGENPAGNRSGDKLTSFASFRKHPRTPLMDNVKSRWSADSHSSYTRPHYASDRQRDSLLARSDGTVTMSESTRSTSIGQDSQRWSGGETLGPRSGHSTLDSETYSTINRVLEHYHDPSLASPEMFHDFQQHMLTKSHELARQGGWDPAKVTQLYLQELGRGKKINQVSSPGPLTGDSRRGQSKPSPIDEPIREEDDPNKLDSSEANETEASGLETKESDKQLGHVPAPNWNMSTPGLEVPDTGPVGRASLSNADDWTDASPSILDWIHPQAADSPTTEGGFDYRPTPPPKDWRRRRRATPEALERRDTQTPRRVDTHHPELPDVQSRGEGLGLVLRVHSPQDREQQAPPPVPNFSPPPPPTMGEFEPNMHDDDRYPAEALSPPSPSVYSKYPASTMFPSAFPDRAADGAGPRSSDGSFSASTAVPQPQRSQRMDGGTEHHGGPVNEMSPPDKGSSPTPDQRRLTKRKHIIRELLDTEKLFHGDMKVTEEIYKGTSNACSAVGADDVKCLFGNTDQLVNFSLTFFDGLRQAGSSVYVVRRITALSSSKRASASTSNSGGTGEDGPTGSGVELTDEEQDRKTFIGEAFGQHMSQLEKVYSEYLKNLEAANKRLQKLQTIPGVALWLNECRSHAEDLTDTWSLDSLIVKPMQRILKYPLLLQALSEVTPEDHPDFTALDVALWEMKAVATRIEDMMKRVSLVEQAVGRKRKESNVGAGISKALGRRTEKFKQQVGLSEMFDDLQFNKVAEKWDSHIIQLQFIMADVEKYLGEVQVFMDRFNEYVATIESFIDAGRSTYPELESKWRKFGLAMRELSNVALAEHKANIGKSVVGPMKTLVKMYDAPQKFVQKRNKRIMDYARYKGIKDRGDKPDKRTQEHGEQFMALNDTLKDELPRLYSLTGKLAQTCLGNLVELQSQWHTAWQGKLSSIFDEYQVPSNVADIVTQFSGDFVFTEAQMTTLGICNGSILADSANFLTHANTLNGDETAAKHRPAPVGRNRARSMTSGNSPVIPVPDFGQRDSGSFMPLSMDGMPVLPSASHYGVSPFSLSRTRASSNQSSQGPTTPDMSSNARSFYAMTPATSSNPSNPARPSTSTGRSMDMLSYRRPSNDSAAHTRPASGSTYFSANPDIHRAPSPSGRPFSGVFSSAMPMTDSTRSSPHPSRTASPRPGPERANVLFTAASIEEFSIDRSRTEAGYPYLTYVRGEIFDIIAEKGELWLARNQDDPSQLVGWLWCKHFARLTVF